MLCHTINNELVMSGYETIIKSVQTKHCRFIIVKKFIDQRERQRGGEKRLFADETQCCRCKAIITYVHVNRNTTVIIERFELLYMNICRHIDNNYTTDFFTRKIYVPMS